MKVLLFNGSPKTNGNTYQALCEAAHILNLAGINTEIIQVGSVRVSGCIACGGCAGGSGCVLPDPWFAQVTKKAIECDGMIFGSPVYFAGMNGTMKAFLDRLFYQRGIRQHFRLKVGAAVAVCRRAGSVGTFDEINHYFLISEMLIAPSTYWNNVLALQPGDAQNDGEGLRTMRNMARNMAWMLQMKQATRQAIPLPEAEKL